MSNYRRAKSKGATYFFTVVTKDRKPWFAKETNINVLREAFRTTMSQRAFILEAAVILPDHLHCIWQLPENDSDFSGRWREIKKRTSRQLDPRINNRGERSVWQRRFWEHQIRNEHDWRNHMDYIHYNPVKHQLVDQVSEWPWSSFHHAVARGWYEKKWGNVIPANIRDMHLEYYPNPVGWISAAHPPMPWSIPLRRIIPRGCALLIHPVIKKSRVQIYYFYGCI